MKKNAFSLIELAVVLTVIGVMVGGSFKLLKMSRESSRTADAKENVLSAKHAIIGDALIYSNLSTSSNFQNNLSSVKGTLTPLLYYPDSLLTTKDICAFSSTNLKIIDNTFTPAVNHDDIAFVVVSEGANFNMQTAVNTSVTPNTITIYKPSTLVDDNTSDENNNQERYDDIVEWVTLVELQNEVGCNENPLRIVNSSLPSTDVVNSKDYKATIIIDGNYSTAIINCTFPTPADNNFSFSLPNIIQGDTIKTTVTGVVEVNCTVTEGTRQAKKRFAITVDP